MYSTPNQNGFSHPQFPPPISLPSIYNSTEVTTDNRHVRQRGASLWGHTDSLNSLEQWRIRSGTKVQGTNIDYTIEFELPRSHPNPMDILNHIHVMLLAPSNVFTLDFSQGRDVKNNAVRY